MTPTDWTQHNGSECPVAPGTLVEFTLRRSGDKVYSNVAESIFWDHDPELAGDDVTAYRVAAPVTAPVAERNDLVERVREEAAYLDKAVGFSPLSVITTLRNCAARITADKAEIARLTAVDQKPVEWSASTGAALKVFGEWAISVSTLDELADLERRMAAHGITLESIGEHTALRFHRTMPHYIVIDATGCEYVCEDRDQATQIAKQTFGSAQAADKAEIERLKLDLDRALDRLATAGAWAGEYNHVARTRAETAESQLAALKVERDGLVEALTKIINCHDRNWQHQREKLDDIVPMARAALEASKERTS